MDAGLPSDGATFIHDRGHELEPMLACQACGRPLTGSDVSVRP